MKIKVYSEIGKLRKVLLHRPGKEVERVYPEIFERILFDDIMWLEQAKKDHDVFAKQLMDNGVEVFYIENLIAEIFDNDPAIRKEFIETFIKQGGVRDAGLSQALYDFFIKENNNLDIVKSMIAGVKKKDIEVKWGQSIESHLLVHDDYPFYLDPIPNILFQRDPIASIFDGMSIHNMTKDTRKREGLFYVYLLKYHDEFKNIKPILDINHNGNMEGGDVLVVNKETVLVGVSERTTGVAVEELANVLFNRNNDLKTVVGIAIPKSHATMHLDTILTQMDFDKFSVDLDMTAEKYYVYSITKDGGNIKIKSAKRNILDVLKEYVHPNTQLIKVANGDKVSGLAEQWNDGANCLALEPGTVFVYDRNVKTNAALEAIGIKLIKVPSGELGRGRGGPRCMSMPLERDDI